MQWFWLSKTCGHRAPCAEAHVRCFLALVRLCASTLDAKNWYLWQKCNKTRIYTTCNCCLPRVIALSNNTKFEWVKIVWDALRWHWTSHLAQPHRMEQRIWYHLGQCLDLFMLLEHAWQMINISINASIDLVSHGLFFRACETIIYIRSRCWWWFGASPPVQLQPPAACNTCRTAVVELLGLFGS